MIAKTYRLRRKPKLDYTILSATVQLANGKHRLLLEILLE